MKKIKLLMFHFAGGNIYSFQPFHDLLKHKFDVVFLELPGRGQRIGEELVDDIDSAVKDLYTKVKPHVLDNAYILYGHSMGGLLSYLIAKMLEKDKLPLPKRIILSSSKAPSVKTKIYRHNLPVKEFKNHLRSYNGTPPEILENEEFFNFYEPILRADFKIIETYTPGDFYSLNIPIVAIRADKETFSEEDFLQWKLFSKKLVKIHHVEGDHFFIFKDKKKFAELLIEESID